MTSVTNARIRTAAGPVVAVAATLASLGFAVPAAATPATGASSVTVPAGFTAAIFASSTTLTKPDDIARLGENLFVAFQNGVGSQGEPAPSGRTTSTVVEYNRQGREVAHWDLTGKIDGLGADPRAHRVIATVNEDGNSSITTIEPERGEAEVTHYAYSPDPLPHGGGTDSVTVRGGVVYLAASAPATDAHGSTAGKPAMYRVEFSGKTAKLTSVFTDDVTATDLVTGAKAPLNLTDPDSSCAVPRTVPGVGGSLMLVGQADKQLVFVRHPGTREQSASVLPLGSEVDDTTFTTAARGTLYVVDNATGQIVAITGNFKRGQAFASAAGLSTVDLSSGRVTPFGSGIATPKGLLFVPADNGDDDRHDG
ncbi:hypothetical protein OG738_21790 [Amycolatopsis sp. NBC_01488]|uniref:hypothetical protein n=1 Tax=Amycolatopsis sp. NBC_01488 TaxID=2903563 RepID=UPI002E2B02EC|nr:hypothetical protein [Amycolatopsis sp. NBC_01488]